MKSKMQPSVSFEPDRGGQDDDFMGVAPIRISPSSRLLRQIADALAVPQSTLYSDSKTDAGAGNTIVTRLSPEVDAGCGTDLDRECADLLHAYSQIRDATTRIGLLSLVKAAADRDEVAPTRR